MKIRYILLLAFAVFIDFLQAALGFMAFIIGASLQAATPIGGGIGGAVAGAYACTGGSVNTLTDLGKNLACIAGSGAAGAAASALGAPLGIVLGFAFDITITLTFGLALIFTLILLGMYSSTRVWSNFLIELVPGLDVFPGWTLMVILCILKDRAQNAELSGKAATAFAKMLLPTTPLGTAVAGIQAVQAAKAAVAVKSGAVSTDDVQQKRINTRQNIKTELQTIDGIKPAAKPQASSRTYVQKAA